MTDQPPPAGDPTVATPVVQPAPPGAGGPPPADGPPPGPGGPEGPPPGDPWYKKPAVWVIVALVLIIAVLAVLLLSGGDDDDDPDDTTTTSSATTAPTTTSTTSTTTSTTTTTTSTTAPPATTAPTANGLAAGDPCSPEEGSPDCIDPEGDGSYTYLIGGAQCLAENPGGPAICSDLDGDGRAGYPDSG